VGLGLSLTLFLFSVAHSAAPPGGSGGQARGTVIVQFGAHDLVARPIAFDAPITGLRALELSGLEVITASTAFGPVVCAVEGVGCPADDCFCGGSRFWGYNYWDGAAWQGYAVGAGASTIADGAVEGWRWGEWGSAMLPAPPVAKALQALDWLRLRQSPADGGYGGAGSSVEALLAIGANGHAAAEWRREPGAPSLAGYWLSRAHGYGSSGAAQAGKLAAALAATGACWPGDAVRPSAAYDAASGAYAFGAGPDAWAMLGAIALGETVPAKALEHLENLALQDGGWEWSPGWGADTNSTALALQALIAAGAPPGSPAVAQGLAYLHSAQNADGGFPYAPGSSWGAASDANSTAYVVQALRATGQDPAGDEWSQGQTNPIAFLLSLQLPDGSFEWQMGAGANLLATQQATVALLGRTFPIRVAQPEPCPARFLPAVSR
jgi:hypothetical protein